MTTETARPVGGYLWTRDSKYIVFVKDNAGDENFNAYAVDPSAAPPTAALRPQKVMLRLRATSPT